MIYWVAFVLSLNVNWMCVSLDTGIVICYFDKSVDPSANSIVYTVAL